MKKAMLALFVMMFALSFAPVAFAADADTPIGDILKGIDPAGSDKAKLKQFNTDMKGKIVTGKCKVVQILGPAPFGKQNRVTMQCAGHTTPKGFNVILFTSQNPQMELSTGQDISFRGSFDRGSREGIADVTGGYTK